VINELKMRGVNDILIAVVDGLKGFPEAITSVYPPAPAWRSLGIPRPASPSR
jgi:transposase-like protein